MAYELFFNKRLVYGAGSLDKLGPLAAHFGQKALLVTGRSSLRKSGALEKIIGSLKRASIGFVHFDDIEANPSVATVDRCADLGRKEKADFILAVGGGSCLDTAKAVSAMMTNPGSVEPYLEAGSGPKPLEAPPVPMVAVPTTAGTGSEVTQNAVINIPSKGLKVSIRSPLLVPVVAVLDPSMLVSAPDDVVAAAGMDAMTQLIEPLTGKNHQPVIDSLCVDGINRINDNLEKFIKDRGNLEAGMELQIAAYYSGLALANAGLGAVHALARPFGGMFDLPHGLACAILLPRITAMNWRSNIPAYGRAGYALGADRSLSEERAAEFCVKRIAELNASLGIPPDFRKYRLDRLQIGKIVEDGQGSSLKNNPADLDKEQLHRLLEDLL